MQAQREGDEEASEVTSWVSVCPQGLCGVELRRQECHPKVACKSSGSQPTCPQLGSLCHVRVRLKSSKNEDEWDDSLPEEESEELSEAKMKECADTSFPRKPDSLLQIPLGKWIMLRQGVGQCDITEACLEGMRAGEKCEIQLTALKNGADISVHGPCEGHARLHATVELKAFTTGRESWEMSLVEKWHWVKSHKERGGVRFRSGDVWGASDSYSRALKLLIPLCGLLSETSESEMEEKEDSDTTDETLRVPPVGEIKIIKAELHSNLSLCQLKLNQPERAKASAAKATQTEPCTPKAWYRLGQACQELNELEEAKRAFRKLLELQPDLPAAVKALRGVICKEKERNAKLGQRLSKMFT